MPPQDRNCIDWDGILERHGSTYYWALLLVAVDPVKARFRRVGLGLFYKLPGGGAVVDSGPRHIEIE